MSIYPYQALERAGWFKLVLGASFQNLPAAKHLSLVWSLAGIDCIDCSADPAVIQSVEEGFVLAQAYAQGQGLNWHRPWIMVSLNDGADPHFRKAYFPSQLCPAHCPRPCSSICPVQAIDPQGVADPLCYGCGRCGPVCPLGLISFKALEYTPSAIGELLSRCSVDALEIHTQAGNHLGFTRLWQGIDPLLPHLKLISLSFPDGEYLYEHLHRLKELILASPLSMEAKTHIIWQTDGISMSGDLGKNTTKPALRLAQKVATWGLPGFIQPAGGTNNYTLDLARAMGIPIGGIAYGSYARKQVEEIWEQFNVESLERAVSIARQLVGPLKTNYGVTAHG